MTSATGVCLPVALDASATRRRRIDLDGERWSVLCPPARIPITCGPLPTPWSGHVRVASRRWPRCCIGPANASSVAAWSSFFRIALTTSRSLIQSLRLLRLRGHDVLLFHVLAPEELTFSFDRWSRFECLEKAGLHIDLDPSSVRSRYLERLKKFLDELKRECLRVRCDLVPLSTEQHLGDALAHYLRRRTRTN